MAGYLGERGGQDGRSENDRQQRAFGRRSQSAVVLPVADERAQRGRAHELRIKRWRGSGEARRSQQGEGRRRQEWERKAQGRQCGTSPPGKHQRVPDHATPSPEPKLGHAGE